MHDFLKKEILQTMKLIALKKYKTMPIQIKAAVWFLLCSIMQKGISVITTPIFTRIMSTEQYGIYSVFNSWMDIFAVFFTLQLYYGVYTQGLVKFENDRKEYSSTLQGLTVTMISVWGILYLVFRETINKLIGLTTIQMIAMFVLIWTTAIFNFWAAEQRVLLNYKRLIFITIGASIAKPIVGVILVVNCHDKATARIWGLAIVEFVLYIGLFITQMKEGKRFFSKHWWKYALKFNIPLLPHYLSQTVLSSSDRIMIEKIVGKKEAGIYSLAYSIALLMTLVNNALLQTVTPWMYQKLKNKKAEEIKKVAYPSLIIIALANLLLILFTPEIVAVFAPFEYREAIWVIPPIAMSVYFMFAYSLFANIEFYYEKKKFITLSTCCAAIVNIVLNYIFINKYGYEAAGYTTLICYVIYAMLHYIFMRQICIEELKTNDIYNKKIILCISLFFVLGGFIMEFTYNFSIIRYGVLIIGCYIVWMQRKKIVKLIREIQE